MRCSSYTLFADLPDGRRTLLVQGASGALDLVERELAGELGALAVEDSGDPQDPREKLPPSVFGHLLERGYLTDHSEAQEVAFTERMLEVFNKKLRARLACRIEVGPLSLDTSEEELEERAERVFDVVSQLYNGRINGELASATLDFQIESPEPVALYSKLIEGFLEQAILWEVDLEVELSARCLPILEDHVAKNYLRKLILRIGDFDHEWIQGELFERTALAVRKGREVEWHVQSETWSPEQIAWLFQLKTSIAERLPITGKRQIQNLLVVPLVGETASPRVPEQIRASRLPVLRALYRQTGTSAIRTEAVTVLPVSLPPVVELLFRDDGELRVRVAPIDHQIVVEGEDGLPVLPAAKLEEVRERIRQATGRRAVYRELCGARCRCSLLCDSLCDPSAEGTTRTNGEVATRGDFAQRLSEVTALLVANAHMLGHG